MELKIIRRRSKHSSKYWLTWLLVLSALSERMTDFTLQFFDTFQWWLCIKVSRTEEKCSQKNQGGYLHFSIVSIMASLKSQRIGIGLSTQAGLTLQSSSRIFSPGNLRFLLLSPQFIGWAPSTCWSNLFQLTSTSYRC
jgi:hypothetical protein